MDEEDHHVQSLTDVEDKVMNVDAAEDESDEEEIEPTASVPLQAEERAIMVVRKLVEPDGTNSTKIMDLLPKLQKKLSLKHRDGKRQETLGELLGH